MSTSTNTPAIHEVQSATARLRELRQSLTFLIPLSASERRDQLKARIGIKRLRLLDIQLAAARQHWDLLPAGFNLKKFERDATMTNTLMECLKVVDEIRDAVKDTVLATANRACVAGSTACGHIKLGAVTADRLKRTVEKITTHVTRAPAVTPTPTIVPTTTAPPPPMIKAMTEPAIEQAA